MATDLSKLLANLSARPLESHKGDFGRALIIGGSRGMAGAAALAGMAALRGGAGLVTVAVPECCLETVAGFHPCYMTAPLPEENGRLAAAARQAIELLIEKATVVACGPGLGRSTDLTALVRWLYKTCACPSVFDADALNGLAENGPPLKHVGTRILTPHPGEFSRLIGRPIGDRAEQRGAAEEFARRHDIVLVLKGNETIVTDGRQTEINATGNPGMATGGTGDVLTGLTAALLAHGVTTWDAARLAVHVHGTAGDLAAAHFGQVALIASDLIDFLPAAFGQGRAGHSRLV